MSLTQQDKHAVRAMSRMAEVVYCRHIVRSRKKQKESGETMEAEEIERETLRQYDKSKIIR